MNLTRLRMYDWVDKASYLFETYTKMAMVDDQRLLNIILYFDSGSYIIYSLNLVQYVSAKHTKI